MGFGADDSEKISSNWRSSVGPELGKDSFSSFRRSFLLPGNAVLSDVCTGITLLVVVSTGAGVVTILRFLIWFWIVLCLVINLRDSLLVIGSGSGSGSAMGMV